MCVGRTTSPTHVVLLCALRVEGLMARSQDTSVSELDQRIAVVHAATELVDPAHFIDLLDVGPTTTISRAMQLWEIAVAQATMADLQVASGDDSPQTQMWQQCWTAGAQAMRQTLATSLGTENAEQTLTEYWEHGRAAKAVVLFSPLVRRVEAALARQRNVIGFHWDNDENAYRQREAELGARIASPHLSDDERKQQAAQLLDEVNRYRSIFLPKLLDLTSDVDQAFSRCERFVALFTEGHYPEVHRWHALTKHLIDARAVAVTHVRHSLDFDAYLSTEVVAGNVKSDISNESTGPVLNEAATVRVKEFAQKAIQLLEGSAHIERDLDEERNELANRLAGDDSSDVAEAVPSAVADPALAASAHPIEHKPWFRLAKVLWWASAGLGVLLASLVSTTWGDFLGIGLVIALVLLGIKKAVYYVMLGRTTLHERPGSGFIDIDMFEREVSERSDGLQSDSFSKALTELRARYGRRAPASVVRNLVDRQLSEIRNEKKRVLGAADRDGKTISVESLRASLNTSRGQMSEAARNAQMLFSDRYLLRLEVKYGPDIPVSVVDQEADALSGEPS